MVKITKSLNCVIFSRENKKILGFPFFDDKQVILGDFQEFYRTITINFGFLASHEREDQ